MKMVLHDCTTALIKCTGNITLSDPHTGSLTNLQPAKCQCLRGREVILFPDVQAYDQWSRYTQPLKQIAARVQVSDLLERKAEGEARRKGWDLGDWLVGNKI